MSNTQNHVIQMAKFKPMELIDTMHGKFHSKSKYYAAEKYGTQFTGKIGELSVPPTEEQINVRQKFKIARQNALNLSTEEINAYTAAFKKNPGKYKSPQGYIIAMEYAKL